MNLSFYLPDYLYDAQKNPLLLELDMIEPNLYLINNPKGLERLTEKLSSLLENINFA